MKVLFERNVACTMRDGVTLRANLFRPEEGDGYPVVLTRLPYGKDTSFAYLLLDPVRLAEAGYMVAIQDVRGCFASEGVYGGFYQEFDDGYDTVEWASKLPGSNGKVGMYGASYFGFTQWAAAVSGHPALTTVAPTVPLDDPWDGVTFRGGALEWGTMASWYLTALALPQLARLRGREPGFPLEFVQLVNDADRLSHEGYYQLPLSEFAPLRRTGLLPDFFEEMTSNTDVRHRDRLNIRPHYATMNVSASLTGGWYDVFLHPTLVSYESLKAAGKKVRLTLGPWTHGNQGSAVGDLDFGMAANSALLNLKEDPTLRHQRWFDEELKGVGQGLETEPPVEIFVMGINRWRLASEWPLPNTEYRPWYLHSQGNASTRSGDGTLSEVPPTAEPADEYVYNPADPVKTLGGNVLMTAAYPAGPKEQTETEMREDVLVFTSEPFAEPVEVTGPIVAKLWVQSSAKDTDFVVRLTDVHPDGSSYNLADGIVRMRHRQGQDSVEWMDPHEVYEILVDLWATSNVFLAGHRVRVQVTSSCFPRWNRNLNTGESNETTAEFMTATQRVLHDSDHPSHLILPVVPLA